MTLNEGELVNWLQSNDGKLILEKALKEAQQIICGLQKARMVSQQTLHEPMTI
jgi:hypothetical protein